MGEGICMFVWKEEYDVGVEHLNVQHKELFNIANKAYEVLKDDFIVDKYDKIVQIIEELKEYTVFHFQSEEAYLMDIKYKKFLSHKIEHEEFINKVSSINLSDIDKDQNEGIMDILKFIYSWIDEHILIRDMEYKN